MQKEKKTSDVFKRGFHATNNSHVYIADTTKHLQDSFWYRRGQISTFVRFSCWVRVGRTICIDGQ